MRPTVLDNALIALATLQPSHLLCWIEYSHLFFIINFHGSTAVMSRPFAP